MKTILGTEIPENIRGIVYLCTLEVTDHELELIVEREILCDSTFLAITLYAEIPNPESQVAIGKTKEAFEKELEILHKNMKDLVWLQQLEGQL